jgi:transposase
MEKPKVTYFNRFAKKAALKVENLLSIIRNREANIRHCYSHTSKLKSDDYVKMIMLAASFIIVYFLEACFIER